MKYLLPLAAVVACLLFAPLAAAAAPYPDKPTPSWQLVLTSTGLSSPQKAPDELFERIAWCESKNDPRARNGASSASGRFQFLESSWEYYGTELWGSTKGRDVFSYKDNTQLASYVYRKYGTDPWLDSKSCWG